MGAYHISFHVKKLGHAAVAPLPRMSVRLTSLSLFRGFWAKGTRASIASLTCAAGCSCLSLRFVLLPSRCASLYLSALLLLPALPAAPACLLQEALLISRSGVDPHDFNRELICRLSGDFGELEGATPWEVQVGRLVLLPGCRVAIVVRNIEAPEVEGAAPWEVRVGRSMLWLECSCLGRARFSTPLG
eukprot:1161423-Pelagomonas_calceolata.AAC.6